jgi:hypothetical protein
MPTETVEIVPAVEAAADLKLNVPAFVVGAVVTTAVLVGGAAIYKKVKDRKALKAAAENVVTLKSAN